MPIHFNYPFMKALPTGSSCFPAKPKPQNERDEKWEDFDKYIRRLSRSYQKRNNKTVIKSVVRIKIWLVSSQFHWLISILMFIRITWKPQITSKNKFLDYFKKPNQTKDTNYFKNQNITHRKCHRLLEGFQLVVLWRIGINSFRFIGNSKFWTFCRYLL